MRYVVFALLLLSPIATLAAPEGARPPKGAAPVSFAKQIQPLLRANCVGCHNARQGQAGLALDSFARAMKGTTKGAVISMVKGLSTELARDGIYVNCVAPGWVATDMAAPALEDPKTRDKVFATIPLGRVGKPEEIAATILFLCTEHAGFITGEVLNVNGGAVLVG